MYSLFLELFYNIRNYAIIMILKCRRRVLKSIEDRIVDKIFEGVNFLISLKIKPDMTIDKIGDLKIEDIRNLKRQGIEGVILDVDETMRKDMGNIPKCNQEWLDVLKREIVDELPTTGISSQKIYMVPSQEPGD